MQELTLASPDATVPELREIYLAKFGPHKPLTTVEFFTASCRLAADEDSLVSLKDLGLQGTVKEPLQIFVVSIIEKVGGDQPHQGFAFQATDRGIATFQTCLKIFFHHMNDKGLHDSLKIMWEITHFPPVLTAVHQLYDDKRTISTLPCVVLATCIREMALAMAPPGIAKEPKRILETSRQIFSWIHSLLPRTKPKEKPLTAMVELRQLNSDETEPLDSLSSCFKKLEIVDVPATASSANPTQKGGQMRVGVAKEEEDLVDSRFLALALQGSHDNLHNIYSLPLCDTTNMEKAPRIKLLEPEEFNSLMEKAQKSGIFRVVPPSLLRNLPQLVITLDQAGFVSTYTLLDFACGEACAASWNAISGQHLFRNANASQVLMQKLKDIRAEREKDGSWSLDAWTEEETNNVYGEQEAEEAVVICLDKSASMAYPMSPEWATSERMGTNDDAPAAELTRLSEVKEIFRCFTDRAAATNVPIHLGLVTFSDDAIVNHPISPILYDFVEMLDSINIEYSTNIWNAIQVAAQKLIRFKTEHQTCKLRIIVLTDGEHDGAAPIPWPVCRTLCANNIILDAIAIGVHQAKELFKFPCHTGGYAFIPETRELMFQQILQETFIDIRLRPEISKVRLSSWAQSASTRPSMTSVFDIDSTQCRSNPHEDDGFICLSDAAELKAFNHRTGKKRLASKEQKVPTSGSVKAIQEEIRLMMENSHPQISVYVSESYSGFWKVILNGPEDSPHADGTFVLWLHMGPSFPAEPPTARFVTPILHPNITKHGRICHPIFDREWQRYRHVHQQRDAVEPLSTAAFHTDPTAYLKAVSEHITKFAKHPKSALEADILNPNRQAKRGPLPPRQPIPQISTADNAKDSSNPRAWPQVWKTCFPSVCEYADECLDADGVGCALGSRWTARVGGGESAVCYGRDGEVEHWGECGVWEKKEEHVGR
ncbi:MAG: hypothetical protein M1814_004510 [Vezdaea aestivalis]|nr:MAG: hypothetical protein M1814_004510 [Vezdaea aestivalis]